MSHSRKLLRYNESLDEGSNQESSSSEEERLSDEDWIPPELRDTGKNHEEPETMEEYVKVIAQAFSKSVSISTPSLDEGQRSDQGRDEEVITLELIAKALEIENCRCVRCMKRFGNGNQKMTVSIWNDIVAYRDERCSLAKGLWKAATWTACSFSPCFHCSVNHASSKLPIITKSKNPIDIRQFDIRINVRNYENCSVHGRYFAPFCLTDLPYITVITGCEIRGKVVKFEPITLELTGEKLIPKVLSMFSYLPNVRGTHETVLYDVIGSFNGEKCEPYYILKKRNTGAQRPITMEECLGNDTALQFIRETFSYIVRQSAETEAILGEEVKTDMETTFLNQITETLQIPECNCEKCSKSPEIDVTTFLEECQSVLKADRPTIVDCALMQLLYHQSHWTCCKWDVCYECLLDGTVSNIPSLKNSRFCIDINAFTKIGGDVKATCPLHGEYFAPELVADLPNVVFATGCSIETEIVDFKPLQVELHEETILKRGDSNFMYLPNVRGYHSAVPYDVVKRFSERNGDMVYLLIKSRNEYKPLPTFEKCLQEQHVQHFVWTNYACMTGTLESIIEKKEDYMQDCLGRYLRDTDKEICRSQPEKSVESVESSNEGNDEEAEEIGSSEFESECERSIVEELEENSDEENNESCERDTSDSDKDDFDEDYVPNHDSNIGRRCRAQTYKYEEEVEKAEKNEEEVLRRAVSRNQEQETKGSKEKICSGEVPKVIDKSEKKQNDGEFQDSADDNRDPNFVQFLTGPLSSLPKKQMPYWRPNSIDVVEALKRLESGKLNFVRSSLSGGPTIDFENATTLSTFYDENISLKLRIDVDSIDIVTCPIGGISFNQSGSKLFMRWKPIFLNENLVRPKNNGLIGFSSAFSSAFPGDYIGKVRSINRRTAKEETYINDPMQLTVFSVTIPHLPKEMKVWALIPTKVLICLVRGSGCLLELFDSFLEAKSRKRIRGGRTLLAKMLWYIISSTILFFVNIGCSDGTYCRGWSRSICCCFPGADYSYRKNHDQYEGHLSSLDNTMNLSDGTLTIALCLMARHQRALEQYAEVPSEMCCSGLRNRSMYRLPEGLKSGVRSEIISVLEEDVGSEKCLEYFSKMWNSGQQIGNLINLDSDSLRRGSMAYPNSESNRKAFQAGSLRLEDMLILNHIVFRGTVHGMKSKLYSSEKVENLRFGLRHSFNPRCFLDGNIDLGYLLHPPDNMNLNVHFRRKFLKHSKILLPRGSRKTADQAGLFVTTGPGFPSFVGAATQIGMCGNLNSSIMPYATRRFKIYSSKWENESELGKTIYDSRAVSRLWAVLRNRNQLNAACHDESGKSMENILSEIEESYERVFHNIEYRERCLIGQSALVGVRAEYTYFFDRFQRFFDMALWLIKIQEEYEVKQGSQESSSVNEEFPWWLTVSMSSDRELPVSLIPGEAMKKWGFEVEKILLSISKQFLMSGLSFAAVIPEPNMKVRRETEWLLKTLRMIKPVAALEYICAISMGLLDCANRQIDGSICHKKKYFPVLEKTESLMCGLSASTWLSGYPSVILSRILSFPQFHGGEYVIEMSGREKFRVAQDEIQLVRLDDDSKLPTSLRFTEAIRRSEEQYSANSDSSFSLSQDKIFARVYKILVPFLAVVKLKGERRERGVQASILLATFFVRTLVSDIWSYMETEMKAVNLSGSLKDTWDKRFGKDFTFDMVRDLANYSSGENNWLPDFRIDCRLNDPYLEYGTCQEAFEGLMRLFTGKKRGANILSTSSPFIEQVISMDSEGFVKDEQFITSMWISALSFEQEDGRGYGKWTSLRILSSMRSIFIARRSSQYFREFCDYLSRALSNTLRFAGFGKLCPAIRRTPNHEKDLWNPILFARMKFSDQAISLPIRLSRHVVDLYPSTSYMSRITFLLQQLKEIQRKRKSSPMKSKEWDELNKEYISVSQLFWRMEGIDRSILKCLKQRFSDLRESKCLLEVDFIWARDMLVSLIAIRRNLGDEGIAAALKEDGSMVSYRNVTSYFDEKVIFSRPWDPNMYPSSKNIFGKKTRVNKLGELLGHDFPMFFKVKPGLTKQKVKPEGSDATVSYSEYARCMLIEDIYEKLTDELDILSARMQWRLSPTTLVAELVLKYNR